MKIDEGLLETIRTEAIDCGLLYPGKDVHERDLIVTLLDGESVYSNRPYGVHVAVKGSPTHFEVVFAAEPNSEPLYLVSLRPTPKNLLRYREPMKKYIGLCRAVRALLEDCRRQASESAPTA